MSTFKWRYQSTPSQNVCQSKRFQYYQGKRSYEFMKKIEEEISTGVKQEYRQQYPISKRKITPPKRCVRFARRGYLRRLFCMVKSYGAGIGAVRMANQFSQFQISKKTGKQKGGTIHDFGKGHIYYS